METYEKTVRSSHHRYSIKKGVLKIFGKFTRKHLWRSLYFNKITGLRHLLVLKKTLLKSFPIWYKWALSFDQRTTSEKSFKTCKSVHRNIKSLLATSENLSCSTNRNHGGIKDSGLFDIVIVVFDATKVCRLVRNFLLHKPSQRY